MRRRTRIDRLRSAPARNWSLDALDWIKMKSYDCHSGLPSKSIGRSGRTFDKSCAR